MKKTFIILTCMALFLTGGCVLAAQEQDSSPAAETIEIKTPDIGEEAGPTPGIAAPAAGQSLENNITAYEELTPAVSAVLEYIAEEPGFPYGIAAYQQMEFEGGTLVLAGGLHDGENHPELYFVDKGNVIRNRTAGSDCWELNFTEFSGKRVYYGQISGKVTEVTLRYDGAYASAAPHSPGVIAVKNAVNETESFIKDVQGYILVTDRKDMPVSFQLIKEDGENVNYSEEMFRGTPVPLYEDVEDPGIRYASLYQYNRMTESGDEGVAGVIGRVSLQSGENAQQLNFAGCFKSVSLQEMFKSLSVYVLCSNFIYESQYLPAGGKAKLVSEKGFPEDAKIRCYFSELSPEMWSSFKTTGTISFLRTFKEPDKQGNIELFDNAGYYLIAVCVDGPDADAGTMLYAGVIGLD